MYKEMIIGMAILTTTAFSVEKVLYYHDFRTGSAGAAKVTGGVFNDGWKQKDGVRGDRIMFTTPSPVKRGYAELTMTVENNFGIPMQVTISVITAMHFLLPLNLPMNGILQVQAASCSDGECLPVFILRSSLSTVFIVQDGLIWAMRC